MRRRPRADRTRALTPRKDRPATLCPSVARHHQAGGEPDRRPTVWLGDSYAGDADSLAAVEYYLSAAYLAPDSPQGRRGLLSAARAYAAAKQPDMATTAYKKLLAQTDLPTDMRDTARKELNALPRPTQ